MSPFLFLPKPLLWFRAAVACLLLLSFHPLRAQNTCQNPAVPPPDPAQGQLWVGATKTHYLQNEPITFRILSNASGPCTFTIREDRYLPVLYTGAIDLVAGVESYVPFTLPYAAFLTFSANQNGQEVMCGVGVDACEIPSSAYLPPDFDQFWAAQKAALAAVPINPQVTQSAAYSDASQTTYKMVLDNIDGKKVYGWISIPNCPGPFAAILSLPSFGTFPVGPTNYDASDGAIGVSISIHDYDCEQTVPGSIAYQPANHFFDRNTNYYKAAILGCIRAIDFIFTRPEFDGVHLAVTGVSQGGGLALMTAGLDPRVKYVCQGVTALCNHAAFASNRSSGFPYWVREGQFQGGSTAQIIEETGYYDVVNFASHYTGPSYNFVGYNDEICPPASVFAAFNQLGGNKSMFHSITTGHGNPPNFWTDRIAFWTSQGIPFSKFWAGCPPVPTIDNTAPGVVQFLTNSDSTTTTLTFSFASTGDDGNTGTAASYDIRYGTSPVTDANFDTSLPWSGTLSPQPSGTPQSFVMTGLTPGTTYFVGIKAIDEANNAGLCATSFGTTRSLSTGVPDKTQPTIGLYPNPTSSLLYLTHLDNTDRLDVLTFDGKYVLSQMVDTQNALLEIGHFPPGIYLVQVWQKSGERKNLRFVKN